MPSARFIDLTGQCFGQLTVIRRAADRYRHGARFLCECLCGNTCEVNSHALRLGMTKRCPVCQERYRAIGKAARQRVDQDPGALYGEWLQQQRADRLAWQKLKRHAERTMLFEQLERCQMAGDTVQGNALLATMTPAMRQRYSRWRVQRVMVAQSTGAQ